MKRALIVLLAACGAKATPAPVAAPAVAVDTPVDSASAATPDPWSRAADGSRVFAPTADQSPTQSLSGGLWLIEIDLPDGVTGGKVTGIDVAYTAPGGGDWSVFSSDPPGDSCCAPAASVDVTVTADEVTQLGAPPRWQHVAFEPPAGIAGTIWLELSTDDDSIAIGAISSHHLRVYHQPSDSTLEDWGDPKQTTPLVRLTLVHGWGGPDRG